MINSVRNNLSPGAHVLAFSVRDDLGYTAETIVNYELSEDRVPSNSKWLSDFQVYSELRNHTIKLL